MTLSVILVECDVTSPAGAVSTLRFADRAVFPMAPTDTLRPNVRWDERLLEPPSLRRTLFDDLMTLEPGLGVGTMALANADRALDAYQGHVWGEVRVWRWTYGSDFSTARSLLTGPAGGTPAFDTPKGRAARVRLTLYDARLELERPIQSETYDGTNNGTSILFEGAPSLKGRLKPLAYGNLMDAHVSAAPVNQELILGQLHDGTVRAAPQGSGHMAQVFDRGGNGGFQGLGDVVGQPYFAARFLNDNGDIAPPYWLQRSSDSLIRLEGQAVGNVAFGFHGDATPAYTDAPGEIIARLLARMVPVGRIGASVAAAGGPSVGVFTDQAVSARELIAWVARSHALAVLPDRQGIWQATAVRPVGASDHTLTTDDLIEFQPDDAAPASVAEIEVGYDRIWTTYRREALQVELWDTPAETRLETEYRRAKTVDPTVKARFPSTWRPMRIDTALRYEADAVALAEILRTLFGLKPDGRPRRQWRATVPMTDARLDLELGASIAVHAQEIGIDDTFLLIGEEPLRPRRDQVIWTLWG